MLKKEYPDQFLFNIDWIHDGKAKQEFFLKSKAIKIFTRKKIRLAKPTD